MKAGVGGSGIYTLEYGTIVHTYFESRHDSGDGASDDVPLDSTSIIYGPYRTSKMSNWPSAETVEATTG